MCRGHVFPSCGRFRCVQRLFQEHPHLRERERICEAHAISGTAATTIEVKSPKPKELPVNISPREKSCGAGPKDRLASHEILRTTPWLLQTEVEQKFWTAASGKRAGAQRQVQTHACPCPQRLCQAQILCAIRAKDFHFGDFGEWVFAERGALMSSYKTSQILEITRCGRVLESLDNGRTYRRDIPCSLREQKISRLQMIA